MEDRKYTIPSAEAVEEELSRVSYIDKFLNKLKSTTYALITVAAIAILVATLLLPVLKIYGTSMTPTLTEGSIVVSVKKSNFKTGDVIAFYFNNKILVKRVIAFPGDWVNIDENGKVYVNGEELTEPYVDELALGDCDQELPYQVPDGKLFVMGDHRSTSQDSRLQMIGCVAEEQIVGKIEFVLWPMNQVGGVD